MKTHIWAAPQIRTTIWAEGSVYGLVAIGLEVIEGFRGTFGDVNFADLALHIVRCGGVQLLACSTVACDAVSVSIIVDTGLHGQSLLQVEMRAQVQTYVYSTLPQ